ncbi:uncharacterized protein LOC132296240 [Cornus florida]|uniref:uncharacterized protein LOC132296240 n=1 Tax=Cornus florida TaxID=4283 RepID=UPI002899526D|nr:uncharacterized protein LOC132296240 [Cornus florida]
MVILIAKEDGILERIASPVLLEQAINYIEGRKKNIKELQRRKEQLMGTGQTSGNKHSMEGLASPVLEVEEMGSSLEVKLITGFNRNFMLHQVLTVLEEENVEVASVNSSTMGDRILYTIHAQAIWPRIGIEISRVQERLQNLVFSIM